VDIRGKKKKAVYPIEEKAQQSSAQPKESQSTAKRRVAKRRSGEPSKC